MSSFGNRRVWAGEIGAILIMLGGSTLIVGQICDGCGVPCGSLSNTCEHYGRASTVTSNTTAEVWCRGYHKRAEGAACDRTLEVVEGVDNSALREIRIRHGVPAGNSAGHAPGQDSFVRPNGAIAAIGGAPPRQHTQSMTCS